MITNSTLIECIGNNNVFRSLINLFDPCCESQHSNRWAGTHQLEAFSFPDLSREKGWRQREGEWDSICGKSWRVIHPPIPLHHRATEYGTKYTSHEPTTYHLPPQVTIDEIQQILVIKSNLKRPGWYRFKVSKLLLLKNCKLSKKLGNWTNWIDQTFMLIWVVLI